MSVAVSDASFGCSRRVGLFDHDRRTILQKPCGAFGCSECGPKRTAELSARIHEGLKTRQWRVAYFLTFTLDPKTCADAGADGTPRQARYGTQALRRMFDAINADRRRNGLGPVRRISVYEWRSKSGAWHAHILVNTRFNVRELRDRAVRAGLGRQLRAEAVESKRRLSRYVAKYVAKRDADGRDPSPPHYSHRYSCSRAAIPTIRVWRAMRRIRRDMPEVVGWWSGPIGEELLASLPESMPGRYEFLASDTHGLSAEEIGALCDRRRKLQRPPDPAQAE